ncbi:18 kDa seed maturation protein [Silene latifolia]|uniref:18 kDa seed maturation protein n=1 Tax=Silene latifolia TaxID=37657 RepID=UPI003D77BF2C
METVKEKAANIAASAISGKEKTKATVQEKIDKIRAKDDSEKNLATEHKAQRITEAELHKQMAQTHNLTEKEARTGTETGTGTGSYSAKGMPGVGTGAHQMSAMPGHGTGQPTGGHVVEGTDVGSHPIGKGTETETAKGMPGAGTGAHQMSAMPGHGTGQPTGGHVVEGTDVGSHPIGKGTETETAKGMPGAGTGAHQTSAMPGHESHETGQPTGGHVVEGTAVGSHPIGKGNGTENRHV